MSRDLLFGVKFLLELIDALPSAASGICATLLTDDLALSRILMLVRLYLPIGTPAALTRPLLLPAAWLGET